MSPLEMIFLAFLFFLPLAHAQVTLNPFPLAVRSPYLNTWFEGYNLSGYNTITSPPNFSYDQEYEWVFFLRVDGMTYSLLGGPIPSIVPGFSNPPNASDTKLVVTPTNTTLSAQAGPIKVLLTFLNPIVPGDPTLQSIPLTYVSLEVLASDNSAHSVQVYTDVGLPVSFATHSDESNLWSVTSTTGITYYSVNFTNPVKFSELDDGATPGWGTLYYAMKSQNITYTMKDGTAARQYFISNGTLDGGSTGGVGYPGLVFALSHDLGTIQSTQDPLVLAFGYAVDPAISYAIPSDAPPQKVERSPCYKLRYSSDEALISDFLNDFSDASSKAQQLDLKILQDAASVSDLLGNLVSPAVAQVYGSIQITCGKGDDGNLNKSDVLAFMRNIDGVTTAEGRVTPVEGLYSAFPVLMYIDPSLGAYLLEPLFQLQSQPDYDIPYAAADLGPNFPNVTVVRSIHNDEVERLDGNMLIMTYAHARASGDGSLINRYHGVLTGWADFLSNVTLAGESAQYLYNNDANLIIKAIIAIGAMSRMNSVLGLTDDANRYANISSQLYGEWKAHALSSDRHLLAKYDAEGSWSLGYNLFADKWLGTNIVEQSIFDGQSNFLKNLTATSTVYKFGLPPDYYPNVTEDTTVSAWNMFAAAMTSDDELRSILIARLNNRANLNNTSGVGAFPLLYDNNNGSAVEGQTLGGGIANPAQGALFAILALKVPVNSINISSSTSPPSSPPSSQLNKGLSVGTIIGSVIGSVAAVSMIGAFVLSRCRRRHDKEEEDAGSSYTIDDAMTGTAAIVTPFVPTYHETTQEDALRGMARQYPQSTHSETAQIVHDDGRFLPSPFSQRLSSPMSSAYGNDKGSSLRHALTFPSEGAHSHAGSNEPQRELAASPTDISEPLESVASVPGEAQGLQLVVESLQREVEQLRAEKLDTPPSYYMANPS
ncbi:hypothetical protein BC826DRAFT_1186270 [Russula brevipes]|nr:hypothetical protein BC826DRAFT_1186270 [Russula brevipes]